MEITTLGPTYIPLMQKPKCCAVACLQMVLYRRGYGLHDQEDLAREFGIKIEAEDLGAFRDDMPIMTSFNFDEGMSTVDSVPKINAFFDRAGVALTAKAYKYSSVSSVKNFVLQNLAANNDVWIEYHSHEIHASHPGNQKIHDALVESFDQKAGTVVLIDPKPTRRQRATIPIDMLERSLSSKFGKELGIVVVSTKN